MKRNPAIYLEDEVRVPITRGLYCRIDRADAASVLAHSWIALSGSDKVYATNRDVGLMHRWLLNAPKGMYVDHLNRDGLDNRRSNLRLATNSQNQMNARVRKGASRFKGVRNERGKWHASIKLNGVRKRLGAYTTQLAAAMAYDEAAVRLFGEYARPNFPERFRARSK